MWTSLCDCSSVDIVTPMNPEPQVVKRPWLQAAGRWATSLAALWFVFVFLLPRFIDYQEVLSTIATLRPSELAALLLLAIAYSLSMSYVYTVVIPGLRFWPGWQAYEASGTLASFAPPGVDIAVRYGMYRSFGIPAKEAGASFVLTGIFTIGIRLVLPVAALIVVLVSGEYRRATLIIVVIAVALAVVFTAVVLLRREDLARRLGGLVGGWYNRLLAGRWKFEPLQDPGQRLVGFRSQLLDTLGTTWPKATASLLGAHTVSFLVLLLSLRFLGVSSVEANIAVVFVAYSVGLIASLLPFLPQGLGAVELVYVLVIAGAQESALADSVMAAAFTHRIFTWFLPIVWGFVPLFMWRRRVRLQADTIDSVSG